MVIGDTIVAVGSWPQIRKQFKAEQSIPGEGRVLMPGLINGHTHSSMTLMRGMADDLELMTWLNDYVFPLEGVAVDADRAQPGSTRQFAKQSAVMTGDDAEAFRES